VIFRKITFSLAEPPPRLLEQANKAEVDGLFVLTPEPDPSLTDTVKSRHQGSDILR